MREILLDKKTIANRVAELGSELTEFYRGKPLTVIALLNGGMIFTADLLREIHIDGLFLDSFAASSYNQDASTGKITIRTKLKLPVEGRHVLLTDDILDTGFTLKTVHRFFSSLHPASVRTCVLLDKQLTPPAKKHFSADWTGFTVPDRYVIGYGLDSNERFRNLPHIEQILPENPRKTKEPHP